MPEVILVCGKICSGKTVYAAELMKKRNCVVLSCDEITLTLEKYLSGNFDEMITALKNYLCHKACEIILAGANVIIDFGNWTFAERESLKKFFTQKNIKTELHYIKVSDEIWEKRIEKRNRDVQLGLTEAYYLDDGLKAKFLSRFEEPSADEIDMLIEAAE